jgi:HAD superfamily hydrolase (TIGR01490 family)
MTTPRPTSTSVDPPGGCGPAKGHEGPLRGPQRPGARPALPRNLCLFDLDDTLLPIDSDHAWGEFVAQLGWVDAAEFRRGNEAFYAQYRAGVLDIHEYIAFATQPLRLRTPAALDAAHQRFMREVITPQLRPAALDLVQAHRQRGDLIALVTATNDFVTAPIARALGIDDLIAVRLERGPGRTITGRIEGTPSYREGKVTRVQEWLAEHRLGWAGFERISVYSDSANDLPLLERATDPVATNPTSALREIAEARGWRILKLFD